MADDARDPHTPDPHTTDAPASIPASIEAQVRDVLDRAADDIDVEPVPTAAVVRRGRTRRRRRRVALGTVGALALVGATGVGFSVLDRGEGGSVATSDDSGQADDEPTVVVDQDATPEPAAPVVDDSAPAPTEAVPVPQDTAPPPADVPATVIDGAAATPGTLGADQIVPWNDGFLAVGVVYAAQPLPSELPEEVRALFPQEVLDLFPDGLPATLDEAINILTEADLLDEVTAVLADHPEASEAIYGVPSSPPTVVARFTTDGATWTPIDLDVAMNGYPQIARAGDALLIWSIEEPTYGPDGELPDPDGVRSLTVARTTDLESWDLAVHDIPVTAADLPYLRHDVWVSGVAATADGWVAHVQEATNVDYDALIPRELLQLGESNGYGVGEQTDGIQFEYWDEDDERHSQLLTWEELGIEPIPLSGIGEPQVGSFIVGDFAGGATEVVPADAAGAYVNGLVSTGDRVLSLGDGVAVSDDGRSWAPLSGLPDDVWVESATPIEVGVLLIGQGPDGRRAWTLDPAGTLTDVDLPDLGRSFSMWSTSSSGAWIVDASEQAEEEWEPQTVVIEHDGFRVEITNGPDGERVVATDLATGAVAYEIEQGWDGDRVDLYEWDEQTGEGGLVLRDGAGETILVVPGEVLDAAWSEQSQLDGPAVEEEWNPDLWLLATDDGAEWLVTDLPDELAQIGPLVAAVSGGNVLYPDGDAWALAPLP